MCLKLATHAILVLCKIVYLISNSSVFKKKKICASNALIKLSTICHRKSPEHKRFSQTVAELLDRDFLYDLNSLIDSKCKCHALGGRYCMYPIISSREMSFPAASSEKVNHSELSFKV